MFKRLNNTILLLFLFALFIGVFFCLRNASAIMRLLDTSCVDIANVKKDLADSNIVVDDKADVSLIFSRKNSPRDESGWILILETKPTSLKISNLYRLDDDVAALFLDWLMGEKNFSMLHPLLKDKTVKIYRPHKKDKMGFPCIIQAKEKCFIIFDQYKIKGTSIN